jgi:hypothetical protein
MASLFLTIFLIFALSVVGCAGGDKPSRLDAVEAGTGPASAGEGAIRVRGGDFVDEAGRPWVWRGMTLFMLPARVHRGESPDAAIDWLEGHGVNVTRVFVSGTQSEAEWAPVYERPFARAAGYDAALTSLIARFEARGLRLELTVFTDDNWDVDEAARTLQHVYDIAAGHPNVFVEWFNEPGVGRRQALLDALLARTINRRGILTSYGTDPRDFSNDNFPRADYLTPHLPRDVDAYAHNSEMLAQWRARFRIPSVSDEPFGMIDPVKYPDWCNRGRGVYSNCRNGGGARLNDARSHVAHFAIAALVGNGATIHTQAGVEGRVPGIDEPVANDIASQIAAVWRFIPAHAHACDHPLQTSPGWPLQNPLTDYPTGRAYAADCGNEWWIVNPLATADWTPKPRAGWRVEQGGANRELLHLVRER